jgi:N-acetylglucosaminyldiphosphoundecaprenol N-acetyl-beta-D-mannosaminyltransferase
VSTANIMGIPVSLEPRDAVLTSVDARVRSRTPGGSISITNTESMYHALRRPDHMAYIQGAEHSLCDGVGVIVAGFFWGARIRRYNGPVLMLDCVEQGVAKGWKHFFLGGKPGVAEEMAKRFAARFPGTQCVGTFSPPFREMTAAEDAALVQLINDSKPDFVWVGLGLVKQEQWIAQHLPRLSVPWTVGVGAAFDYHSGAVPWAPTVLRALGLEWLFRLIIQPRLRAKRYWWSLVFVLEAVFFGMTRFGIERRWRSKRSEAL